MYGQDSYFAANFAGEDAIEVFNTFQFPEVDEKKVDKVFEQFERYCHVGLREIPILANNTEGFLNRGSIGHAFEKQGKIMRVRVGRWHGKTYPDIQFVTYLLYFV